MSPRAKFMFDVDFAGGGETEAERARSQQELDAAIADAESRGYRAGHTAALHEEQVQSERRTAAALERIGAALAAMSGGLNAIERRLEAEAVEVAVAVASKLAPELIAREPFGEICALAADCFNHLVGAPHVVVRVNDALYADARERIEEIARMSGFEGRLVVLAEPDIGAGDCRIEWADGGLTRDRAATEAAINEAVGRYVAARRNSEILSGELRAMSDHEPKVPLPNLDGDVTVNPVEQAGFGDDDAAGRTAADLEAVFDVPVQVSAVLGRARMQVGELLKLGPGTVLELDRKVGEAIDIYVNNRLVARGEVVLVEEKLGVTMTEIIKPERS